MRKKNRETEEEAREITKTGEASVRKKTAERSEKESRVRFGKEVIKYEKNAR